MTTKSREERKKEFPHNEYRPAVFELYPEARMEDWYDAWGVVMGLLFDVLGEMHHRGLDIPEEWRYSPGAGGDGRDPDSYHEEAIGELSDVILRNLAMVLHDYSDALEEADLDY